MRTRLKVCCIASVDEARTAIDAGAYALGLVAAMPSGPGCISDEVIAEIAESVPASIKTFLLTARTEAGAIAEHVARCRTNTVQLVDAVDSRVYGVLRRAHPSLHIVQVIHVEDDRAIDEAQRVAPHVDALLLDSGRPSATVKELGGTGRVHDWTRSRRIVAQSARPVFLAGGIRDENVGAAVRAVRPFGIDLCTGVRTNGNLDKRKLERLVAGLRTVDAERLAAPDERG